MTRTRVQWCLWLTLIGMFISSTLRVHGAGALVEILFDGGNAFVVSAPKQITIGAVAAQSPESHYNMHRMRLMVTNKATYDPKETTFPPVKLVGNPMYWDLYGWRVEICPGGICPTTNTLSTSPVRPSKNDCKDQDDNIGFIPDFDALHQGVRIVAGWRDRLDSELLLRAGKLIGQHGVNCFELKGPNGNSVVRNVAVKDKEIKWSLDAAQNPSDYIDLVFTPKYGVGTPRKARLKADGNRIELRVWTLALPSSYPKVKNGDEILHFQQFYSLFSEQALPTGARYKMYGKELSLADSPGTECPPAMLIAP